MSERLQFFDTTPSWTKLGSAEFFRILAYPKETEVDIKLKAEDLGVSVHLNPYWIEGPDKSVVNMFLKYCAQWFTHNKLSLNSHSDLLLSDNDMELEVIPRPSTLLHIPSNRSNIKPMGIKEIENKDLPNQLLEIVEKIEKEGYKGATPEEMKNFKIFKTRRFIEFNVVPESGKQGECFSCGQQDHLLETKETQSPLTVGISNYGNFFSYHSVKIGYCRACSISNHFALGRVLYFSDKDSIFLAIPEANTIKALLTFITIIEEAYREKELRMQLEAGDPEYSILLDRRNPSKSNFLDYRLNYSGFYFLILALLFSLKKSIDLLSISIDQESTSMKDTNRELLRLLGVDVDKVKHEFQEVVFNSWSFILKQGNDKVPVRHWRIQNSKDILNVLTCLGDCSEVNYILDVVKSLIYTSGHDWISRNREDFSRSLLNGTPSLDILEKAGWDKFTNKSNVSYKYRKFSECIFTKLTGGTKMENDEILKQCKHIGYTIAEIAKEQNRGIMYDLRSVGNPQALRTFIEKLTFTCSVVGKPTNINSEFVNELFSGESWKKYKSMIAIVANQHYGHLAEAKKEVVKL